MSLGDRGTRGGHLVPVIVSNPNGNPAIIDFPIAGKDAFACQRVSEPYTVFDSKQLFDSDPLYWDDAQTSGGGQAAPLLQENKTCHLKYLTAT